MTHQADVRRTRATGTITVKTYDDRPYDEPGEVPSLHRTSVVETFSGDIAGEGRAEFLQAEAQDGSASFVGMERVVGTLAGRAGSFLLQDQGTVVNQLVSGRWFVVPGSGTGALAGGKRHCAS